MGTQTTQVPMDTATLAILCTTLVILVTPPVVFYTTNPTPRYSTSYYKVGQFATVSVYGYNLTIRERRWLETEEEGEYSTVWEQAEEVDTVVARWKDQVVRGVISKYDGHIELYSPSYLNGSEIEQISPEEAHELNLKDPVEAPPNPYTIQPSNLAKYVFISGPPGAGKSSIAAWLSVNAGYVYYEGDSFMEGLNPYVPANASEPSLAVQEQHPLVGIGMHRRKDIMDRFSENFDALNGDYSKVDRGVVDDFLSSFANDITKERNRVGGDWIIAFAVPDQMSRDLLRSQLGNDLVFVVLTLSPDLQEERLAGRHLDDEEMVNQLSSIYRLYESPGKDEERVLGFDQKPGKSIVQNSQEVLRLVEEYYQNITMLN